MEIPFYQIDAFTGSVFSGNPAGVCLLDAWLPDDILQSIAAENNLSETAFIIEQGDSYGLRWFSPKMEVDLCGHATLASAFALFEYVVPARNQVSFRTQSGLLTVTRLNDMLAMDFPTRRPEARPTPEILVRALGIAPRETYFSIRDCMAVFDSQDQVRQLQPDMKLLCRLDAIGIIATARGTRSDFVSRFFAPKAGVPEDPVTGSAHCTLVPYWAEHLNKSTLHALQISNRGGELYCRNLGDRVQIAGRAVTYLNGTIAM